MAVLYIIGGLFVICVNAANLPEAFSLIFSCAFKPTPSIGGEQESVSLTRQENTSMVIKGRHDPCIVPRAVPVVEAAAAVAVVDLMMEK